MRACTAFNALHLSMKATAAKCFDGKCITGGPPRLTRVMRKTEQLTRQYCPGRAIVLSLANPPRTTLSEALEISRLWHLNNGINKKCDAVPRLISNWTIRDPHKERNEIMHQALWASGRFENDLISSLSLGPIQTGVGAPNQCLIRLPRLIFRHAKA